jgi:hypothetical protein
MSERLPYELQLQQQWLDLPLPDENMAWADMRRRLEEDEDRPVIAWWRRGCAGWIIIGLLLIAIIWWWLRPDQWFVSESSTKQQTEQTTNSNTGTSSNTNTNTSTNATTNNTDNTTNPNNTSETTAPHNNADPEERSITPETTTELTQHQKGNTPTGNNPTSIPGKSNSTSTTGRNNITSSGGGRAGSNPRDSRTAGSTSVSRGGGSKSRSNQQPVPPVKNNNGQQQQSITTPGINNTVAPADSTPLNTITNTNTATNPVPIDSTAIAKKDPIKKDSTVKPPVATTPKIDSAKKNRMFFSAGIGMHQQIPLNGQKLTPYSASGRKFSLADYIPSVYFRVNKENKWFIQGEFRYGAPQYTKDILFFNRTKRDSAGQGQAAYIINERRTLKKTFYHQLPVTFNYFVLPNLSLGAGVAWNKFSSAIVDRQRSGFNARTLQDTTFLDNGIIKVKKDSAFSSSYFQAVLETHYQWKRFSFGARYMFGLQPYLKFNAPGNTQREEKNSSLQLFIRYELWRSRKK